MVRAIGLWLHDHLAGWDVMNNIESKQVAFCNQESCIEGLPHLIAAIKLFGTSAEDMRRTNTSSFVKGTGAERVRTGVLKYADGRIEEL